MSLPMLLRRQVRFATLLHQSLRCYAGQPGYWNHDWKPGPYPKTEEERIAAARKYNLIPEDYEPYPDDGTGCGDYPNLPIVSASSRDLFENFEFPELKRNFGEPFHVDADLLTEDRYDFEKKYPEPPWRFTCYCIMAFNTVYLLWWIGEHFKVADLNIMPRHDPFDGRKHYSFDLVPID